MHATARREQEAHNKHLQEVCLRHRHRLMDVLVVDGGDVDGSPVVDAEVDVKDGELVQAVVVAVAVGGPDEVLAARRERAERVAAARAGGAGEVADGAVALRHVRVVVRRVHDGVEPVPGVNEADVGDVEQAAGRLVVVGRVGGDAAVDADETCAPKRATL